jgi:hypothetical protein
MIDDLDHVLVSEDSVTPSGRFLASVMQAVREDHRHEIPLPFPWSRFITGLAGGLACTVLSVILLAPESFPLPLHGAQTWLPITQWLGVPESLWLVIVLAASLLAARLAVVLTSD